MLNDEPPKVWEQLGSELSSWNFRDRGYDDVTVECVKEMSKAERGDLKRFLAVVLDADLRSDEYREVYACMGSDCSVVPRGNRNAGWREHFEYMLRTVEEGGEHGSST